MARWARHLASVLPLLALISLSLGSAVTPAVAQQIERPKTRGVMVSPPLGPERRVALVIGNADYRYSPLRNPSNDARAMAGALQGLGFQVILKVNASWQQMRRAIIDFGQRLKDGGVGLFYYAGHGVQIQGSNYLIPVGAAIEHEDHVTVEGIPLNQVLARMAGAQNKMNIVILDACRNNPFASSFRSPTHGLAQTSAPPGTYIAYATAPGDVAIDGRGRNSVFTESLTRWMSTPGLRIEDVFKRVRTRVYAVSAGRQVPWTSSSITSDFYFVPKPSG